MVSSINYRYSTLEKFDTYPEYGDSSYKKNTYKTSDLYSRRHKATVRKVSREDKIKASVGAIAGTVIPMAFMMKKQKVHNPLKLKYELSDMVVLSATSIIGGVAAGMINENKDTNKNKLKEGVFQFLNASIPAWVAAGGLKLCETSKNFNNIPGKIMAVIGGLLVGMYGSASLSNLVCDPKDKVPDRKLTLLDCVVNLDDALGVLVLAKFPFADKLHLERALPFIYSYCGYRAGKSN